MSDDETLNRRLRAVERSLTDGDHDVDELRDAGDLADRVESLETQLADAEDRITELEAVTQALRGYVGNVRSVNEDVEQRADAALAAVERLEAQIDSDETAPETSQPLGHHSDGERFQPQRPDRGSGNEGSKSRSDTEKASVVQRVRDAF